MLKYMRRQIGALDGRSTPSSTFRPYHATRRGKSAETRTAACEDISYPATNEYGIENSAWEFAGLVRYVMVWHGMVR